MQSRTKEKVTLTSQIQVPGLRSAVHVSLPERGQLGTGEYVEYALDVLVHNLIASEQIKANEAHFIRTQDMRNHIKKLAERVVSIEGGKRPRSRSGPTAKRWAIQPNALPITIFTNRNPLPRGYRNSSSLISTKMEGKLTKKNVLETPMSSASVILGGNKRKGFGNSVRQPVTSQRTNTSLNKSSKSTCKVQRFKVELEMKSCTNSEISLNLSGRQLTVVSSRSCREQVASSRTTIDNIQIPPNVNLDTLKISRRDDGTLVIEEF